MDTNAQPAAMTPDQALAMLGPKVISRASFYAGIKRGDVPHVRVGKRILIPRSAFLAWLSAAGSAR
jgi:excisionase family DNA binding protein